MQKQKVREEGQKVAQEFKWQLCCGTYFHELL
jgi:hypothetical protein